MERLPAAEDSGGATGVSERERTREKKKKKVFGVRAQTAWYDLGFLLIPWGDSRMENGSRGRTAQMRQQTQMRDCERTEK